MDNIDVDISPRGVTIPMAMIFYSAEKQGLMFGLETEISSCRSHWNLGKLTGHLSLDIICPAFGLYSQVQHSTTPITTTARCRCKLNCKNTPVNIL
jgi:hypothetical protein